MAPGRQRMSSVDAAWLHMDRPTNPMMIVGVMTFDEPLELARVRRTIGSRFLAFDRFRAQPRHELGIPVWETSEAFDLADHVVPAALPAPAGKAELQALVSRLAGEPLDRTRPLWQFHVVERYGPGSALVVRIHHCYADGIALTRVTLSLTDPEPGSGDPPAAAAATRGKRSRAARSGPVAEPAARRFELATTGLRLFEQALAGGTQWLGHNLERGLKLARNPDDLNEIARHAVGIAAEVARVATLTDDVVTRFKGPLGRAKRAAWAEPLPLHEVRTIARTLGVTINDVLMSSVAGALGGYLRSLGDDTTGVRIRAVVPVNLRHPEAALELGNHFGIVFLDLPIGISHPLERLYAVHGAMAALKDSYQPVMMLGLLAALGMMPGVVENAALDLLGTKVSTVVSNVPGPREPRYFAGRRVRQQMFWVPQSGGLGLGVSVLTYAGQVQFGLIADRKRIPDPQAVVQRFAGEFERLLLAVLMGPVVLRADGPAGGLGGSA